MKVTKSPIRPTRLRQLPSGGFSWIDRRFIRAGHINQLPREAVVLYFFLNAVADGNGMSFYADPTIRRLIKLDQSELLYARDSLVKADLIAYRYPLYQVLELPKQPKVLKRASQHDTAMRNGEPVAIAGTIDKVLAALPRKLPQ